MSTPDLSVWDRDVIGSLVMVAVGIVSLELYKPSRGYCCECVDGDRLSRNTDPLIPLERALQGKAQRLLLGPGLQTGTQVRAAFCPFRLTAQNRVAVVEAEDWGQRQGSQPE